MADPSSDTSETVYFRSDKTTEPRAAAKTPQMDVTSYLVRSFLSANVTSLASSDDFPGASPSPVNQLPSSNAVNWTSEYSFIDQLPGYSPWDGIRTAAILGSILAMLVAYLCIKNYLVSLWTKRHLFHSFWRQSSTGGGSRTSDRRTSDRRAADRRAAVPGNRSDVDVFVDIDLHRILTIERPDEFVRRAELELELIVNDEIDNRPTPTPSSAGESFRCTLDGGNSSFRNDRDDCQCTRDNDVSTSGDHQAVNNIGRGHKPKITL